MDSTIESKNTKRTGKLNLKRLTWTVSPPAITMPSGGRASASASANANDNDNTNASTGADTATFQTAIDNKSPPLIAINPDTAEVIINGDVHHHLMINATSSGSASTPFMTTPVTASPTIGAVMPTAIDTEQRGGSGRTSLWRRRRGPSLDLPAMAALEVTRQARRMPPPIIAENENDENDEKSDNDIAQNTIHTHPTSKRVTLTVPLPIIKPDAEANSDRSVSQSRKSSQRRTTGIDMAALAGMLNATAAPANNRTSLQTNEVAENGGK